MANENEVIVKIKYENDEKSLNESVSKAVKYFESHNPGASVATATNNIQSYLQNISKAIATPLDQTEAKIFDKKIQKKQGVNYDAYSPEEIARRIQARDKMVKSYQESAKLNKIRQQEAFTQKSSLRIPLEGEFDKFSLPNKKEFKNIYDTFNHEYKSNAKSLADDLELSARFEKRLEEAREKINDSKAKALQDEKKDREEYLKKIKEKLSSVAKFAKKHDIFKPLTKGLSNLGRVFKRIVTYRAIRSIISAINKGLTEGVTNLYKWSKLSNGTLAQALDKIATSIKYITNAVGAMIGPVVEAVAPLIESITEKFVELTEKISKVYAVSTGRTWFYTANKQAQELLKTERQIMGFDVINKLSDSDDYSSMFNKEELDEDSFSFATRILEIIKSDDWTSVGNLLATKINGLLELKGVDFASKIASIANKITTLVKGMIEGADWEALGTMIANYINKIDFESRMEAFYSFASGLVKGLTQAIAETDFTELTCQLIKSIFSVNFIDLLGSAFAGIATVFQKLVIPVSPEEAIPGYTKNKNSTLSTIKQMLYDVFGGIFMADGGIVDKGSLFIAGEAGPELVTSMNGRSAVFNMDQLSGYLANANQVVANAVIQGTNAIVSSVNGKNLTLSTTSLGSATNGYNNSLSRRFGN